MKAVHLKAMQACGQETIQTSHEYIRPLLSSPYILLFLNTALGNNVRPYSHLIYIAQTCHKTFYSYRFIFNCLYPKHVFW
ncbi:hypothetical protein D9M68_564800 [compost metagenome]